MSGVRRIFAVAGISALALSGCNTEGMWSPTFMTPRAGPTPSADGHATKESEKIIKLPARPEDLDCPQVAVADGGASTRVGGETSQEVRYQINISDVSRECDPQGAMFALKVGVTGDVLIGPAGSPGAYSTSLHVEVKRQIDGKSLFSKNYSVNANTNGGDRGTYTVVTEPIMLPLTRARLDDDYSIVVGLGGGGNHAAHTRHKRRQS